jgi:hypothetical protein
MMAKASEVLDYLLPDGGWTIQGEDFNSITYDDGVVPVSKAAFDGAFSIVDDINAEKASEAATTKAALLERLGITADEAALLLG